MIVVYGAMTYHCLIAYVVIFAISLSSEFLQKFEISPTILVGMDIIHDINTFNVVFFQDTQTRLSS